MSDTFDFTNIRTSLEKKRHDDYRLLVDNGEFIEWHRRQDKQSDTAKNLTVGTILICDGHNAQTIYSNAKIALKDDEITITHHKNKWEMHLNGNGQDQPTKVKEIDPNSACGKYLTQHGKDADKTIVLSLIKNTRITTPLTKQPPAADKSKTELRDWLTMLKVNLYLYRDVYTQKRTTSKTQLARVKKLLHNIDTEPMKSNPNYEEINKRLQLINTSERGWNGKWSWLHAFKEVADYEYGIYRYNKLAQDANEKDKEIKKKSDRIDDIQSKGLSLANKSSELIEAYAELKKKHQNLDQTNKDLKTESTQNKENNKVTAIKMAALQNTNEQLGKNNQRLNKENEDLKTKIESNKKEKNKTSDEMKDLGVAKGKLIQENQQLNQENGELKEKLKTNEKRREELETENLQLEKDARSQSEDSGPLEDDVEILQSQLSALKMANRTIHDDNESLKKRNSTLNSQNKTLQEENNIWKDAFNLLATAYNTLLSYFPNPQPSEQVVIKENMTPGLAQTNAEVANKLAEGKDNIIITTKRRKKHSRSRKVHTPTIEGAPEAPPPIQDLEAMLTILMKGKNISDISLTRLGLQYNSAKQNLEDANLSLHFNNYMNEPDCTEKSALSKTYNATKLEGKLANLENKPLNLLTSQDIHIVLGLKYEAVMTASDEKDKKEKMESFRTFYNKSKAQLGKALGTETQSYSKTTSTLDTSSTLFKSRRDTHADGYLNHLNDILSTDSGKINGYRDVGQVAAKGMSESTDIFSDTSPAHTVYNKHHSPQVDVSKTAGQDFQ